MLRHITCVSLFFISLYVIITNHFLTFTTTALFLLASISRLYLCNRLNPRRHLSFTILWLFLEFSFPGFYLFHKLLQDSLFIGDIWVFQSGLALIGFLAPIFALGPKLKKCHSRPYYESSLIRLYVILAIFTLIAFALSLISYYLGITKMGVPHPLLPYKLEPLLNLSRTVSIPCIFTLMFYYFFPRKIHSLSVSIIYICWLSFETYIRGSRGVMMMGLLPLFLLLLKMMEAKKVALIVLLLIPIGVGSFSIGNHLRQNYIGSTENEEQSKPLLSDLKDGIWEIYFRTFNDVVILNDFRKFFKPEIITSRFSELQKEKGLNKFYTHQIKGFEQTAAHAQGITALSDGYAYFGSFGLYFTLTLLAMLALFNDSYLIPLFNLNQGTQVLFTYFIWTLLMWGDGFYDFYTTRSIATVLVFPLSVIISNFLLSFLLCPNESSPQ